MLLDDHSKIRLTYGKLGGVKESQHFSVHAGIHFTWALESFKDYLRKS